MNLEQLQEKAKIAGLQLETTTNKNGKTLYKALKGNSVELMSDDAAAVSRALRDYIRRGKVLATVCEAVQGHGYTAREGYEQGIDDCRVVNIYKGNQRVALVARVESLWSDRKQYAIYDFDGNWMAANRSINRLCERLPEILTKI